MIHLWLRLWNWAEPGEEGVEGRAGWPWSVDHRKAIAASIRIDRLEPIHHFQCHLN